MNEPDRITPTLAPSWTTSEFWSKVAVDAFGVVALLLTLFTGSDKGIQGAEAAIPAAALIASAIAHAAYSHSRTRTKIAHLEHFARMAQAEVERLQPLASALAPVVEAADPALAARARAAEAAEREVTQPAK